MNITQPITRCQHKNYAPKVAQVIKTRGFTFQALWARCEVYLKSGDYILCLEDCDEISQILGRGHPNWARRIQSMKRRVEFLIEQHECKRKLLVVKCADEKIMAALAKLKEVVVREPRASVNDPRDDPFTEIFGLPLLG
jgi:hypothetical protein